MGIRDIGKRLRVGNREIDAERAVAIRGPGRHRQETDLRIAGIKALAVHFDV